MGRGRSPRGETADSEPGGRAPGRRRGERRGGGWPPRRRRCSSARSGSARRGAARAAPGRPQSGAAGPAPRGRVRAPMRAIRSLSSRSTSACPQPTISGRATTTRSRPPPSGRAAARRKLSRSRRRARLRATAPPTRRPTARPSRSKPCGFFATTRRKRRPPRRAPRLKTASNSAGERSRLWRPWRDRIRPRGTPPLVRQAAIRLRPFWRRRFRTSWPPLLRMRTRKPWVRLRRRLLG